MSTINTNIPALAGVRNLNQSQEMLGKSLQRLSSGSKIVTPADDAAGLAVSEKMSAQGKRVRAAVANVQNAMSYVQTADGFMSGMTKVLARMSELVILGKDVTKSTSDIALYQEEFQALQEQLRATVGGTAAQIGGTDVTAPLGRFNGNEIFGSRTTPLTVQIGEGVGQTMAIGDTDLRSGAMLDIISQPTSGGVFNMTLTDTDAIAKITAAIQHVATERATLGASQSRLDLASSTLLIEGENLESAISRIKDVDVAEESTQLAKYNILVQSGTAMLAQANLTNQNVLRLLQS